jgi:hypothetical protein
VEEWIKVGAEVASVCGGQHKSVTFSKIARIGKRWLFLENGEKFHTLGLDRGEGPVIGGRTYRLYPADHPKVREVQMDLEIRSIMRQAIKAAQEFTERPTTQNAEKAVLALLPFTPFLLQSSHDIAADSES